MVYYLCRIMNDFLLIDRTLSYSLRVTRLDEILVAYCKVWSCIIFFIDTYSIDFDITFWSKYDGIPSFSANVPTIISSSFLEPPELLYLPITCRLSPRNTHQYQLSIISYILLCKCLFKVKQHPLMKTDKVSIVEAWEGFYQRYELVTNMYLSLREGQSWLYLHSELKRNVKFNLLRIQLNLIFRRLFLVLLLFWLC